MFPFLSCFAQLRNFYVILFLGTGVIWLSRKEGSFAWEWKNRFLGEMRAEAKGSTDPDIVQKQKDSKKVRQTAARGVKSHQEQEGVKDGKQEIK
jgi:hypothetical protein